MKAKLAGLADSRSQLAEPLTIARTWVMTVADRRVSLEKV